MENQPRAVKKSVKDIPLTQEVNPMAPENTKPRQGRPPNKVSQLFPMHFSPLTLAQLNLAPPSPTSIAPLPALTHLVPPGTKPSLHSPRLAFGHRFGFHPSTPNVNNAGQLDSIMSSGKLSTVCPPYMLRFLHIQAHIHTPVAAPSAPVIDPLLSRPERNIMVPNHADASDDEEQADAESESSGSEDGQGPVLIQSRVFSN
jgi:hypothetical protein